MTARLRVPARRGPTVRAWATAAAVPLEIVTEGDGAVEIVEGAAGQQSSTSTLRAGGWIACATAFEAAARLGITPRQLGPLLDELDIRIRACQLGCFE